MQPTVTPRQLDILRFIRDFRAENGYSPTMQEIGDHLNLTKVTVFEHVGALEKKELLLRGAKHKARSLRISPEYRFSDETSTKIPLVGRIAAGMPIEAVENTQFLDLEDVFANEGDTFVLEVSGESMIDEQICDGDFVVCRKQNTARPGQTVVALLSDGEATLKLYYPEKGRVRLQPANPAFDPIFVEQCDIQGIVVGLIRKR
ncbi:MAG: transcriptional repressor LexA [Planctomycetes bacterium]|jgi:repressor LexA|nr:transcriptional repressor LexA [Phycisphaerae bacterium]NBB95854.1 transcriptional repressor LexA [Planctomycetota bacterium]